MNGSLTLREHPGDLVRLACEKCGRAGRYCKATLIELHSATSAGKCTIPAV